MPSLLKNRAKILGSLVLAMIFLHEAAITGDRLILTLRGEGAPATEVTRPEESSFFTSAIEDDSASLEESIPSTPVAHNWLLVIGIDGYLQWPALKNSVHDSKAVRDILMEHYMFDREHVMELYDEQATRKNIIERLEELARKVEANDKVLIYYAGHGEHDQTFKRGYWIPVDANTQSTAQYLSNTDLQTFLGAIKSRSSLVISDACFSGTLFPGAVKSSSIETAHDNVHYIAKLKARQALISGGNEPVMDGGVFIDQHSIFAHYLIDRLGKNTDKYLTASTLHERIKTPVSNKSLQTPECNAIQNTGDEGGEFLFVRE